MTNIRYVVNEYTGTIEYYYTIKQRATTADQLSKLTNNAVVDFDFTSSSGPPSTIPVSADVLIDNSKTIIYDTNNTGSDWPDNNIRPAGAYSFSPGRQANITIGMNLDKNGTVSPVTGTFVATLLPNEFTFNGNISFDNSPGPYHTEVIPNFAGTGQTLVRIYYDSSYAMTDDIASRASIGVDIAPLAELKEYSFPTWMGLKNPQASDTSITEVIPRYSIIDIYDLDQDGKTTDNISGVVVKATLVSGTAANVVKMTKGPYDADWTTNGSRVEEGDAFQYRVFFRNDSPNAMTNLVMIDVFPYVGDVDPFTNVARGSQWAPVLTGPITGLPGGAVASYSTSTNPIMAPVGTGGSGNWVPSVSDWSTVKAVKIEFGSRVYNSGQTENVYLNMQVPTGITISSGLPARNSVDYKVDKWDGTTADPLLTAASDLNNTYFRIPQSQIGDFVWMDTNGNGLQDAGELGINGVAVELYSDVDGYTTPIQTTTTVNSPSSQPGYYLFDGLRQGNYKVKFPVDATHQLTLQKQGTNPAIDSDPNQTTGWTDVIALLDDQNLLTIDAGYSLYQIPVKKELTSSSSIIKAGDTVSYRITVTADKAYATYSIVDTMNGRLANFDWVGLTTATRNGTPISVVAPPIGNTMTFAGVGSLAANDVIVLEYSLKAKANIAVGTYSNIATAQLDGTTIVTPPVEVVVPITKVSDKTSIRRGENVTYTVIFDNGTGKALSSWTLADVMTGRGTNFNVVSATVDGTPIATPTSSDTLNFTGGALNIDQKVTIVYVLQAKTDANLATYTNTATVTLDGKPYAAPPVDVAVTDDPLKKVTKDQQTIVNPGENITYIITLTAEQAYTTYSIQDTMTGRLANFDWVSMTATKNGSPVGITAPALADAMTFTGVGALAKNDVVVIQYTLQAKNTASVGMYENTAQSTLDGTVQPPIPPVEVVIPILKSADKSLIHRGELVTYTIDFQVFSSPTATWTLTDVMPDRNTNFDWVSMSATKDGAPLALATPTYGDTLTFTGAPIEYGAKVRVTYVLRSKTTADLKTYTNTATVTFEGRPHTAPPINVTVIDDPLKKVAKSGQTKVEPNQNVTYQVTLTADKAYSSYTITDTMLGRLANFDWVSMTATLNGSPIAMAAPTLADVMTYNGVGGLVAGDVILIEYTLKAKNSIQVGQYTNTATGTWDGTNIPNPPPPVNVVVPITKVVNKNIVHPNEEFTYTIEIQNTSTTAVANYTIQDAMPGRDANFTWVSGTLSVNGGAPATITAPVGNIDSLTFGGGALPAGAKVQVVYTLKAKVDVLNGSYTNTAQVVLDGVPGDDANAIVRVVEAPIRKTIDGGKTTIKPGESVSYTIELRALGNYTSYSIKDVMPDRTTGFNWGSATIQINSGTVTPISATFGDTMAFAGLGSLVSGDVVTLRYTMTAKDTIAVGTYTNTPTAILDGAELPGKPVDIVVPIIKGADKTSLHRGEQVTYTVTFENGTGQALASWSLADTMSGRGTNFDVISATVGGVAIATPTSADTLTFTGGALAIDQKVTIVYVLQAKTTANLAAYTNTATVTLDGKPYAAPPVVVTVTDDPLKKTAKSGQQMVEPGQNITYQLTLTADKAYTNYTLTDTMSGRLANFDWVSMTATKNGSPIAITAPTLADVMTYNGVGGLAKNDVILIEYTLKAKNSIQVGKFTNTATGTWDGTNIPNPPPPVDVTVPITKASDKTNIHRGENVTYTVIFENGTGKILSSWSLADVMVGRGVNFDVISATVGGTAITPPASADTLNFTGGTLGIDGKVTIVYVLQAKTTANLGAYTNTATVTLDGKPYVAPPVVVTVTDDPLKKAAKNGQLMVEPGKNITYTLTLTADKAYANYLVTDTMTGRLTNFDWVGMTATLNGLPTAIAAPVFGDVMTYNGVSALALGDIVVIEYTLKAKESILVGKYTNTAEATLAGTPVNPPPPVDVTVPITKSANKSTLLKGEDVTYTVTFQNGTGKALASWSLNDTMSGRGTNFNVISATVDGAAITTPASADTLTFTGGNLAIDQKVTIVYVLQAKTTAIATTYTNTATVTLDGKPYAAPPVNVTIGDDPLKKVADNSQKTVEPGQNISYTLTLTADKAYSTYAITDTMTGRSTNFDWVSMTATKNGSPAGITAPTLADVMTFNGVGALAQNDVVVIKYTLKAKDTIQVGSYSNTAAATLDGTPITPPPPVVVYVPITKDVDKTAVKAGEELTYTINLINGGTTSIASWYVNDNMTGRAANFDWVAGSGQIRINGGSAIGFVDPGSLDSIQILGPVALAVGDKVVITYKLKAKSTIALATYTNIAEVFLNGTPGGKDDADVEAVDNPVKITGTVFEDANANGIWESGIDIPFPAHTVTLKDSTNTIVATTTTDTNGGYAFPITVNGTYTVEVDMTIRLNAGWTETVPTPTNVNAISVRVVAVSGAAVNGQDFGYNLKGRITGYTLMDTDSSGVYIPADMSAPIAGAKVSLIDIATNAPLGNTVTDATGKFVFDGVDPKGTYRVEVDNHCTSLAPLNQAYAYCTMTNTLLPLAPQVVPVISMAQPISGPYIFGYRVEAGDLLINKKANIQTVRVGELVPYTITIENTSTTVAVNNVVIQDMTPPGFKYVSGSAKLDRVKIADPTGTRPVYFHIGTVNAGQKVTLTYILIAGAGVQPGEYKNVAVAKDPNDNPNSNESSATVTVITDPLFDDSLVFGKVFYDKNGDLVQQKDEPGIGGVKLVTVRGEIITTDKNGRYHIPGVYAGRWDRGANFVLKLDTRSLPEGAKVTSENPRVKRATPGVPLRVDFTISLPPQKAEEVIEKQKEVQKVEEKQKEHELETNKKLSIRGVNFAFDDDKILPEFEIALDQVIEVLKRHPEWKIGIEGHTDGMGSEAYNQDLSQRRANSVRNYLVSQGIPASQLVEVVGYGKGRPVATNDTAEGRYLNRRVDFIVK